MAETASAITPATSLTPTQMSRAGKALYLEDEIVSDWLNVFKWSFVLIAAFTIYHSIEKFAVQAAHPFIYNPAEFSCRVVGFSHYTVGLLFLLSAKRMKRASSWAWLAGLLVVGILLCAFFYAFGANKNPVLQMLFFLYFIVHGYRDTVFFYRPTSLDPDEIERSHRKILNLTQACLLLSLFFILVPLYLVYLKGKQQYYEPELKSRIDALMPYLKLLLIWGSPILLVCCINLWRAVRRFPGAGVLTYNRPVLFVLIFPSLIFLVSPLLGVWTFHLLVLTHFVGWYFYASRRLAVLPKQSHWRAGPWRWIRSSVTGFRTLHVSVAVLFFILILFSYLFSDKPVFLNIIVNSKAFYYWTLIHVTISFAPR
jgi:hypothetical protein